jgi:membrane-bound lytic murein transglycosylase D
MTIDYMFDDRRDAIISSWGAAQYLRANFDMLQTWPLAITGYNSGPNGMRRAVERLGTRDIGTILERHESPTFRFASRNFYACFLAVLQIMEDPAKYLGRINYHPRWQATSVELPAAIRPAALIGALGITEREFKRLNPAFRPVVFNQQMVIPAGRNINIPHTRDGEEALAALRNVPAVTVAARTQQRPPAARPAARTPAAAREIEPDVDGYYTVVRGDNLHGIATRLGIHMAELARTNNITNASRIYVGQVLRIPSAATPPVADTLPAVATAAPATVTDTVPTAVAPATAADTAGTAPISGTAAVTDTLPATQIPILADIRVSVTQPCFAPLPKPVDTPAPDTSAIAIVVDTLSPAALREAEIPAAVAPLTGKPATDPRFDASVYDLGVTVAPGGASGSVRVSVDETIGHFAEWMRVDAGAIRRMNNIGPNDPLTIGRVINIPIRSTTNLKNFEVSRLQYHMAIEEDFFARYEVVDFERRTVRPGDSLWKICSDARIPMWLLKKYNRGLRFHNLQPGTNLWIPKTAAKEGTSEPATDFAPAVTESDEY